MTFECRYCKEKLETYKDKLNHIKKNHKNLCFRCQIYDKIDNCTVIVPYSVLNCINRDWICECYLINNN